MGASEDQPWRLRKSRIRSAGVFALRKYRRGAPLKAGGVALNLTAASHVFQLELTLTAPAGFRAWKKDGKEHLTARS